MVDSVLLIDDIRLIHTNVTQPIPNGGFEDANFNNVTLSFQGSFDPMAAVIPNLGLISPPEGGFMGFLATGIEASSVITTTIPPGIVVTPGGQ